MILLNKHINIVVISASKYCDPSCVLVSKLVRGENSRLLTECFECNVRRMAMQSRRQTDGPLSAQLQLSPYDVLVMRGTVRCQGSGSQLIFYHYIKGLLFLPFDRLCIFSVHTQQ